MWPIEGAVADVAGENRRTADAGGASYWFENLLATSIDELHRRRNLDAGNGCGEQKRGLEASRIVLQEGLLRVLSRSA